MAQVSDIDLKGYFETGDKPTQTQFANLIDSKRSVLDKILVADLHQDIVDILDNVSADTNLGNSDLTLTGNRNVDCNEKVLSFNNADAFFFDGNSFEFHEIAIFNQANKSVNLGDIYNNGRRTNITLNDSVNEIILDGNFIIRSINAANTLVERMRVTADTDIAETIFRNTILEVRNENNARHFLVDITENMEVQMMGDVDRAGNATQVYVVDGGKVVGILAKEGLLLQASINGYIGYAVLKTNNILEGVSNIELPFANNKTLAVSVNGVDASINGNVELPVTTMVLNQTHLGSTVTRIYSTETTAGKYRVCVYLKILTILYEDTVGVINLSLRYNDENGVSVIRTIGDYTTVGTRIFSPIDILTDGSRGIQVLCEVNDGTYNFNSSCTIEKIN